MLRAMALFAAAALASLAPAAAGAQTYPNRVVKLVSPFAPGGGTDILGRYIADKLTTFWKQTVMVENRPGAGGNVGAQAVAKAEPDGYTLLVAVNSHAINPHVYRKVPFDLQADFAPVAMVATSPFVLAVNASLPVKNVGELIAYAKAHPNTLNYGSAGFATAPHLAGELFNLMTGTEMKHVPYQGSGPNMTGLLRGEVQVSPMSLNSIEPFLNSGQVRLLAAMGSKRHPGLPELPTVAEAGVPGYEVDLWYAILAPARTPKDVIAKLSGDLKTVLASEEVQKGLPPRGYLPAYRPPEQLAEIIAKDLARWKDVTAKLNLKIE